MSLFSRQGSALDYKSNAIRLAEQRVSQMTADDVQDPIKVQAVYHNIALEPVSYDFAVVEPKIHENGTVELTIPFSGSPVLLEITPSRFSTRVPNGEVKHNTIDPRRDVILHGQPESNTAEAIRAWIADQKALLIEWTESGNRDAETHNADIRRVIDREVQARRAKLATVSSLKQELGRGI